MRDGMMLDGLRVVDFSTGIAGPYATKLLADAGADVVKVEPDGGDPTRRWTASGTDLGGRDGALFEYLNTAKRSIIGDIRSPAVRDLVAAADVVIESGDLPAAEIATMRTADPRLCVVSISPYGRTGPWADRPATEFILQAECGTIASRGPQDRGPVHVGGLVGQWIAGGFTAFGAVAAVRGARVHGQGEHVDVSLMECIYQTMGGGTPIGYTLGGYKPEPPIRRPDNLPSVVPTADGYVGFCTITGQQFRDFLVLIEREDLLEDTELATFEARMRRADEFLGIVDEWVSKRTTDEVVELAALFRIPVTPLGTPETITDVDQYVARGIYAPSPSGRFRQPRVPYQVDGTARYVTAPAPALGEHEGQARWPARDRGVAGGTRGLPFTGLRIVDLTAFWAGPTATSIFALLGADVIKIESVQRPDGHRFAVLGPTMGRPQWWEFSPGYQMFNLNKRGITLDLTQDDGRELLLALVEQSDALVENFSPRVLDHFGVTWEMVHARNPKAVMMRMPAFGLSGPWRDRGGFAQTIEQASGLAWMNGFADQLPSTLRGTGDPLSGLHAAYALACALEDRDRTGQGHFVEASMIEAALNVAAEAVIEHEAYGTVLMRDGNRGPQAVPQGVYPCSGHERWIAIAVTSDEQWRALRAVMGEPQWALDPELDTSTGRRRHHDTIDDHLRDFTKDRERDTLTEELVVRGVPAGRVAEPAEVPDNPQLRARRFFEPVDNAVIGEHVVAPLPYRLGSHRDGFVRRASPMLGEHNHEILGGLLGLAPERLADLEAHAVIGTEPRGA
jgi:crotonobetainyl-CoA:carnitine CoA-transferase CaiB-like acyl-CoA transferase